MQTQIRLTAIRKLITRTEQPRGQGSIGNADSLPLYVSPHCGTLIGDTVEQNEYEANPVADSDLCPVGSEIATSSPQVAAELYPESTGTERLEAIKRRLAEQIQKN